MNCDHRAAVTEIFEAFKSPSSIADATGLPLTTVCDWRMKGKPEIPPWRRADVLAAANRLQLELSTNARSYLASRSRAPRDAAPTQAAA